MFLGAIPYSESPITKEGDVVTVAMNRTRKPLANESAVAAKLKEFNCPNTTGIISDLKKYAAKLDVFGYEVDRVSYLQFKCI